MLDAWRQVTEILLCAMPTDQVLSVPGAKQRLILELLQMLLNKVLADGALLGMYVSNKISMKNISKIICIFFSLPEMTNQVSGVVLLLMTALRQTYSGRDKKKEQSKETNETFISILDVVGEETQGKLLRHYFYLFVNQITQTGFHIPLFT